MVDGSTIDHSKFPIDTNFFREGTVRSEIYIRRIAPTITVLIENNIETTNCTLEIRPDKKGYEIHYTFIYRLIFDTTKNVDEAVANISFDQIRISHNKHICEGNAHKRMIRYFHKYGMTNRLYLSFKFEFTHTLSQIKYKPK